MKRYWKYIRPYIQYYILGPCFMMMEVYERLGKNITVDLVGQYIQHERISQEFAEYYELYQKYQQDYQITEILQGKNSEAMVKKSIVITKKISTLIHGAWVI